MVLVVTAGRHWLLRTLGTLRQRFYTEPHVTVGDFARLIGCPSSFHGQLAFFDPRLPRHGGPFVVHRAARLFLELARLLFMLFGLRFKRFRAVAILF